MSSVISTIHPNPPLSSLAPFRCYGSAKQTSLFCSRLNRNVDKGGLVARLCLALLRNISSSFKVADKAVRNFDMVSYHRGNPRGFPLFFGSCGRREASMLCMLASVATA